MNGPGKSGERQGAMDERVRATTGTVRGALDGELER